MFALRLKFTKGFRRTALKSGATHIGILFYTAAAEETFMSPCCFTMSGDYVKKRMPVVRSPVEANHMGL